MNEKSKKRWIDPELEVRIVALVLGEASDFERDELQRLIESQPELAAFYKEMQSVHGMLEEIGEGELEDDQEDWKLPTEKRAALLAALSGEDPPEPTYVVTAQHNNPGRRRLLWNVAKIAAVFCGAGFFGSVALMSRSQQARLAEPATIMDNAMSFGADMEMAEAEMAQMGMGIETAASGLDGYAGSTWSDDAPATRYALDDSRSVESNKSLGAKNGTVAQDSKSALGAIRGSLNQFYAEPPVDGESVTWGLGGENELPTPDLALSFDRAQIQAAPPVYRVVVPKFDVDGRGIDSGIETREGREAYGRAGSERAGSGAAGYAGDGGGGDAGEGEISAGDGSELGESVAGIGGAGGAGFGGGGGGAKDENGGLGKLSGGQGLPTDSANIRLADDGTQLKGGSIAPDITQMLDLLERDGDYKKSSERVAELELPEQPQSARDWDKDGSGRHAFWDTRVAEPTLSDEQTESLFGKEDDDVQLRGGTELRYQADTDESDRPSRRSRMAGKGVAIDGITRGEAFGEQEALRIIDESLDMQKQGQGHVKELALLEQSGQVGQILSDLAKGEEFGIKAEFEDETKTREFESAKNFRSKLPALNAPTFSVPSPVVPEASAKPLVASVLPEPASPVADSAVPESAERMLSELKSQLAPTDQPLAANADWEKRHLGLSDADSKSERDDVRRLTPEDARLGDKFAAAGELSAREERPPSEEESAPAPAEGIAMGFALGQKPGQGQYSGGWRYDATIQKSAEKSLEDLAGLAEVQEEFLKQGTKAESLWNRQSGSQADDAINPRFEPTDRWYSYNPPAIRGRNGDKNSDWSEKTAPLARLVPLAKSIPPAKSAAPAGLNEIDADQEPFSTFSLHVSDVAFKLARTALARGEWPESAKVRIEEFVNAFDYGDPMPSGDEKVACVVEQSVHPFLQQRNMLRVSMRTAAAGRASNTPLRLTLLLDNSGSMERIDRRQTVRRAFALLTDQLKPIDQVTLISFARQPRLMADKVGGAESKKLVQMIQDLPSEGGTNLEAALRLAYEKAREQMVEGAQNRVVLLTDGAVNLGNANPQSLSQMVTTMRDNGIAFDAAGISAEGLNDEVLEALTRQGDGRYYLLESAEDADDGFARQIAGALRPSAKNVKIQVEFNPDRVGRYKLLGFEKHILKKEDFRNDTVDAAEMAAAEAGVAIYQFESDPNGVGDVGSVSVRFRDLSTGKMVENRWPIPYHADAPRLDQAAPPLRIATSAALLAAKLRGDAVGESVDLKTLFQLIATLPSQERQASRVQQLQQMIQQARQLSGK